mgnify:CR=1 FL=1
METARIGRTPVVCAGRIGLEQARGEFDGVVGLWQAQAKLMALMVIGTQKAMDALTTSMGSATDGFIRFNESITHALLSACTSELAAMGVSDDDIGKMARYFAEQPLQPQPRARDEALHAKGKQLAEQTRCGICHLPTYVGREQMPRLAGQREDYLLHAMRTMQSGKAIGRDPIMTASIYGISDADLQALSHFFAQIKP